MHKPLLLYDYHEVLVFLSKLVHIVFTGTTACIKRIQNQCGGSLAGLETECKLNSKDRIKFFFSQSTRETVEPRLPWSDGC